MITYIIDEYGNDNEYQGINCCFCGVEIVPHTDDGNAELGDCKHLIYICTNETWDSPESMKEDIFKNYDEDNTNDDSYEFLDKNLSDKYLMIISSGHLDGITIFKQ